MRPIAAIAGSIVFFFLAPGVVAGLVPYLISDWRRQGAFLVPVVEPLLGAILVLVGAMFLIDCFARFAREGQGTPAPIAPPRSLVVSGAYRHVRNPMYVAVVSIIWGQALIFGNRALVGYGAVVWLLFHLFVLVYEEPALRRAHGEAYARYAAEVGRWWPRISPWRGAGTTAGGPGD